MPAVAEATVSLSIALKDIDQRTRTLAAPARFFIASAQYMVRAASAQSRSIKATWALLRGVTCTSNGALFFVNCGMRKVSMGLPGISVKWKQ